VNPAPLTCPFCDSPEIEMVSPWGGQLITRQLRCRSCSTYFEAVRPEFDAGGDEPSTSS
jgi:formate dehydrogenase maturation protein FdhE